MARQNMSKKILYVQLMNFYAPSWGFGGPVRMMFEYAKWMKESFKVIVFTGDVDHDFSKMDRKKSYLQHKLR